MLVVQLNRKAGSVDMIKSSQSMSAINNVLSEYSADCIDNIEKTGLFYELLPRRTYVTRMDNRRSVRETKAIVAKLA